MALTASWTLHCSDTCTRLRERNVHRTYIFLPEQNIEDFPNPFETVSMKMLARMTSGDSRQKNYQNNVLDFFPLEVS